MYATIQKWGNSQGLRLPKALLDAVGLKEHDRVELVQMEDGINIRRASAVPHRTLEERLTAFYGKPIDQIGRVESGELDANYFQHITYLNNFNAENGTHLVSVADVHYEPFGIYAGKTASLEELQDGAQIGVPNDPPNGGRALLLLQEQGLITLKEDVGLEPTKLDIAENPHNYEIVEMEAAQLPRSLGSLDIAVINGNYAMEAGFSVGKDALATEDASSEAAQTYANVLVVKEGRENDPAIQALYAALTSDKVKDYINSTYDGAVVPIF